MIVQNSNINQNVNFKATLNTGSMKNFGKLPAPLCDLVLNMAEGAAGKREVFVVSSKPLKASPDVFEVILSPFKKPAEQNKVSVLIHGVDSKGVNAERLEIAKGQLGKLLSVNA